MNKKLVTQLEYKIEWNGINFICITLISQAK